MLFTTIQMLNNTDKQHALTVKRIHAFVAFVMYTFWLAIRGYLQHSGMCPFYLQKCSLPIRTFFIIRE